MQKVFKYLGTFLLIALAMSLTFCSLGIYQGFQTANRIFAGAENYTCRQFVYDLENPETDKFAPIVLAAVAYGTLSDAPTDPIGETRQQEVMDSGTEPAVRKVYALCKGKPDARVLNLFTASITGVTTVSATAPAVSSTTISPTAPATSQ